MLRSVNAQDVYDYVRKKIIFKELFPGARIIEEDLAADLHTSRTTVRAGIMRLHYEGLVVVQRNRGAFVAQPNWVDMNHVYTARRVLELEVARLALPRITDEAIARMDRLQEKLIALEQRYSMAEYVKLNQAFHWELVQAADNEYLEKFLRELFNKSAIFLIFYDNSNSGKLSIRSHQRLLDALHARDEAALLDAVVGDIKCATDCITIS